MITASTGNHGQSIAFAARLFGVRAIICIPEGSNPVKVAAMRGLGAELVVHGRDFDEAREHCERLAREHGYRYVHSANEPALIAGVGTETLEIFEQQPQLDAIVVPIGGGSGAAGACIVAKAIDPAVQVIGVQSERAPAAYRSWRERRARRGPDGDDRRGPRHAHARSSCRSGSSGSTSTTSCSCSDDELRAAQLAMIETTRNLVEAAGASPLAAALRLREELAGKRVALIASGGNASPEQLRDVLALG